MNSSTTTLDTKKKKKGLGARIRGIVRRKKRNKNKSSNDGNESVGSQSGVSLYSYDDEASHQQQQQLEQQFLNQDGTATEMVEPLNDHLPNSALDPNIMSRIVEETSEEGEDDYEDDDDDVDITTKQGNGSHITKSPVKRKSNPSSPIAKKTPEPTVNGNNGKKVPSTPTKQSKTKSKTKSSSEDDEGNDKLCLALLLIDSSTLRFELLEVEFHSMKDATVSDALEQIQEQSFWRPLPFVGVVDRKGNVYKVKKQSTSTPSPSKSKSPKKSKFFGSSKKQPSSTPKIGPFLEEACQYRPKRSDSTKPHRDVLVGYIKNTGVDKIHQQAITILNDPKVVTMLTSNGYSLQDWKQEKQNDSTLHETPKSISNVSNEKKTWMSSIPSLVRLVLVIGLGLAIVFGLGMKATGVSFPTSLDEMKQMPTLILDKGMSLYRSKISNGTTSKEVPSSSSTPQVLKMDGDGNDEDTSKTEEL